MQRFFSGHVALIAFGLICLSYLALVMIWWSLDSLPPHWDMTIHLRNVLQYQRAWEAHRWDAFLRGIYTYYPPFIYQLTAVLSAWLGKGVWVYRLVMLVFVFLAAAFTFKIGQLVKSAKAGLLASFLLLFCPVFFAFSHDFMLDVPLVFFVTASLYLLMSGAFKEWRKAVLLGVLMGLGMLTKWTFGVFMIGPVAFFAYAAFCERKQSKQRLILILGSLAVAVVLALPWYLSHAPAFFRDANYNSFAVAVWEREAPVGSLLSRAYYLVILVNDYLHLPLFGLVLFGAYQLLKRRNWALAGVVAAFLLPVYIILAQIPNKDPRYIFPILPVVFLVIAFGVSDIRTRWRKLLLVIAMGGWMWFQTLGGVVNLGRCSQKVAVPSLTQYVVWYEKKDPPEYFVRSREVRADVFNEYTLYNPFSYFGRLPRREDWQQEEIADQIRNGDRVLIKVDNDIYFHENQIRYFAELAHKNISLVQDINRADVLICDSRYCDSAFLDRYGYETVSLPNGKKVNIARHVWGKIN